jgi:ribonuclease HII
LSPTLDEEWSLRAQGFALVAGLDEVGRGCWAGPVVAAAVVLPVERLRAEPGLLAGVDDSKRLTARQREAAAGRVREVALGIGIGAASPALVDALGIVRATLLAMRQALGRLPLAPDFLLVDGLLRINLSWPQRPLVRGDARCLSIAAASVVAKVHRDALMVGWADLFPDYGFESHKGYGTRQHKEALGRLGPCLLHRRSFAPVHRLLQGQAGFSF